MLNHECKILASQIDVVQSTLAPDVWVNFCLRKHIKQQIFELVKRMFSQFSGGFSLVKRICIVGSITTKQYTKFSDIDVNIEVDKELFLKLNPEAYKYQYGIYAYMMDRLVPYLEGLPVNFTTRTFSIHIYFYPFILSSDNIYCIYPVENWIKGLNFPESYFDPEKVFYPIKFETDKIKQKLLRMIQRKDLLTIDFLRALEKFLEEWRQVRFIEAVGGRGHYLSYSFSADWDTGNIAIKFLGEFAKPFSLLTKND